MDSNKAKFVEILREEPAEKLIAEKEGKSVRDLELLIAFERQNIRDISKIAEKEAAFSQGTGSKLERDCLRAIELLKKELASLEKELCKTKGKLGNRLSFKIAIAIFLVSSGFLLAFIAAYFIRSEETTAVLNPLFQAVDSLGIASFILGPFLAIALIALLPIFLLFLLDRL